MTHTNTNEKAAGASYTSGPHTDTNGVNFRTAGTIDQAHDGKALATQLQRLALAGHTVHRGDIGDFTVCKYGMSRYCQDFAALQDFAKMLGVSA